MKGFWPTVAGEAPSYWQEDDNELCDTCGLGDECSCPPGGETDE